MKKMFPTLPPKARFAALGLGLAATLGALTPTAAHARCFFDRDGDTMTCVRPVYPPVYPRCRQVVVGYNVFGQPIVSTVCGDDDDD